MQWSRSLWRKAPFHWTRARSSIKEVFGKEVHTGKAIQCRVPGHSMNCLTLKIDCFLRSPTSKISAPILGLLVWRGANFGGFGALWLRGRGRHVMWSSDRKSASQGHISGCIHWLTSARLSHKGGHAYCMCMATDLNASYLYILQTLCRSIDPPVNNYLSLNFFPQTNVLKTIQRLPCFKHNFWKMHIAGDSLHWRVSFGTTFLAFKSQFQYHLKSQEQYHLLRDHFRTTKIGVFEDFGDTFWCQLVFLCFVVVPQLVSCDLLFSIFQNNFFFGNAVKKFRVFFDIGFQKNTIKIGFFKRGLSSQ